ncbi:hypothetical protein LCGC14_1478220 [marine sediment metagenome]|uniref:Uncharacterized protein n=1 Tax=marine sediment metagenome TaxID=412755 RepID=A0A0F9JW96_9ZZZZ
MQLFKPETVISMSLYWPGPVRFIKYCPVSSWFAGTWIACVCACVRACPRVRVRLSAETALWLSRWVVKRLAELLAKLLDLGVVVNS